MPSTTSILSSLKNKYPQFSFKQSDDFSWSFIDKTIFFDIKSDNLSILLIHELSHALLGHDQYENDIQLIIMERQAWDYAIKLAATFNIEIPDNIIQSNLDSYRNWLHKRSTCPKCHTTGVQSHDIYKCLACNHHWRVNQAKKCSLRRYDVKPNKKTHK